MMVVASAAEAGEILRHGDAAEIVFAKKSF